MATAGTLLSDLHGGSGVPAMGNDADLVKMILTDMNQPSSSNPVMNMQPQASGYGNKMIQSPNPNTPHPAAMDPATATAHMIGKEYPTPADFASMMHAPSPSSMYASVSPPPTLMNAPLSEKAYDFSKGNLYTEFITQMKQPLLVAIIIFLVSLPALNVLIGHYMPSMLRMGGDLTTAGLVIKAAVGGFLFWFIQKILVPLMMV